MSSMPPKMDARRRPGSVLSLKLWEAAEGLAYGLEKPSEMLELLVSAVAKGEQPNEPWQRLHDAAVAHDKVSDLAFAYEAVLGDKRIKLLPPEQQAYVHLRAARFFGEIFGDRDGAAQAAERALAIVPGHAEAFSMLEGLLSHVDGAARLAQHYVDASGRETERERKLYFLRRAAQLFAIAPRSDEQCLDVGLRILKLDPSDTQHRENLVRRLLSAGRHKDVVDVLEAALAGEPAPSEREARELREFSLDLCASVLHDLGRALEHAAGLLRDDPRHELSRRVAESLIEHPKWGPRAAAVLSDAYEKAGELDRAIAMLSLELKQVRGPRRVDVQRRLGILRQDVLGDLAGALELLAPVVAGDPGDDALRGRLVELSLALNQPAQAARLLSRALHSTRDPAVRARVAADVGSVYLKAGERKKAQAAFQQVLELNADSRASLEAARRLSEFYTESGELKQLASVLEKVVELEPEREARQAAARRLARLSDGEVPDSRRAIIAFRALIGSPWSDEALRRLEELYTEQNDDDGLADVLTHRAERCKDPAEARALAFKAAELRSLKSRDRGAAIAAWQALVERYGPSPDLVQRLKPLLEHEGLFGDLVSLLRRILGGTSGAERAELLAEIGQVELLRLNDPRQALSTFAEALKHDPCNKASRLAVEKMLAHGELRLEAARVLEPILREEAPASALIRVLELRADLQAQTQSGLEALEEALVIAENQLGDRERALAIAERGLKLAVASEPQLVPIWLERVQQLANASGNLVRLGALLDEALGDAVIESAPLFELARAAGEALASAGNLARAVEIYKRTLAYAPASHEIVARIDELLAQTGAPEERLTLYATALERETDPLRRRELLHASAALRLRELGDVAGAVATWQVAVVEDPRDFVAHDALVSTLSDAGDWKSVYVELARVLPFLEGERRNVTLLRLAEVANQRGDHAHALEHYRELLANADLADDVLATIELLAREQGDGETTRTVLERRLAATGEPRMRAALLERLGNAFAWQLGDPARAAHVWLEGARLCEGVGREPERARKLYERVLDADPNSLEAAERLIELSAQAGDWDQLAEAFTALLRVAKEREIVLLLIGLEEQAVEQGKLAEYVALVDSALERIDAGRAQHVLFAKARALGALAGREAEASALYRELLEAGDDSGSVAEHFEAFLRRAELTPERVADYRWLYEWKLAHAAAPADVTMAWAEAEERLFSDLSAASALFRRTLELDADRVDALTELARLELALGRAEQALAALELLRERADGEMRTSAELQIAALLFEPLGRAAEAVELCAPILMKNPGEPLALRLLHRALSVPEARASAALLLERVAEAADNADTRADVIEALLAVSHDAPELAAARSRWLTQLLKTKEEEPGEALRIALRGAESAPGEEALWNVAEEMTRRLNDPNPLAEAFERAIGRDLEPELADKLGRRVVEFFEEWFDEPERVVKLLERVLELCPSATWAFDRLKLAFNAAGRWAELFQLYDRRLAAPITTSEAIEVLREAAMAAKDFAGDAERAIGYLERLNQLSPGDTRVDAALERLYERHGHKRPLIELLSARLGNASESERGELNGRIAALWLDLGEPVPAFDIASKLLGSERDVAAAVALLERTITMPASAEQRVGKKGKGGCVLSNAARLLKEHYRAIGSTVDVVRMLEIEVDCSENRADKIERLEEIVGLRLEALSDAAGAFETVAALVQLRPDSEAYRARFLELAAETRSQERRAEVLIGVARGDLAPELTASLLAEAADVYDRELGDRSKAMSLYREVVELRAHHPTSALHAARQLAGMLRSEAPSEELASVLEVLSILEPEPEAKRAVLGEAAVLAFDALSDPERAIKNYRASLAIESNDLVAVDGLCRALEAAGRWDELIVGLESRATLSNDAFSARADRVRIAKIYAEIKNEPRAAVDAWFRVRELHGRDVENFTALSALLETEQRFVELAELVEDEVSHEAEPERRRELYERLGALHEERTGRPREALEAYVAAGDWSRAVRVAGARYADAELGRAIAERLLELAVASWLATGDTEGEPARTADWALRELCHRLLEAGHYEAVVERLLEAAKLPFPVGRQRELRREAACLASDRLGEAERAIELFQALLDENPSDEVAASSVTRLALLLEEKGRTRDIVELWERQAAARSAAGDPVGSAALWARAAEIAEIRLGDLERAIADHERGAELGGEASLEALSRIHTAAGRPAAAAKALEALCAQSTPEALGERALRLCEAYVAAGHPERARQSLERARQRALETRELRARLRELYRDAKDHTALAALIAEEAELTSDVRSKLEHLREAAALHVEKRNDPASAVPLLERAVELDPDDPKLRLKLSQALYLGQRYPEAASVLREQLARYGARKPKERAQVHFQLARVLIADGQEGEALNELDTASRIDPAHPGIMQMLARVAFKQSELDRAERMYRALLLTAGRDDDPESPGKTEALVSLSEIAALRGDELRASEFIESAFEAALENPREATVLDQALRSRGRYDLLARLFEARLAQGVSPEEAANLLAALAEVHVEGLKDFDQAAPALRERARAVQATLEASAQADDAAWAALGRLYERLGDVALEALVLERRVNLSRHSSRPPADPDLFYRLAAVRLSDPEQRADGLELLERALDVRPDFERAEALLKRALGDEINDPRAAGLLERIARASGDARALGQALLVKMKGPAAEPAIVREGVDLAKQLGDNELVENMIGAALANEALSLPPEDSAFLRLTLADIKEERGDAEGALALRESAAPHLLPDESRALLLRVARDAEALGQEERAENVYNAILREQPGDREAWMPLLSLYRRSGRMDRWVLLLNQTVPAVESPAERNMLRLEQARVLTESGNFAPAIDALKEILLEEPTQSEAAELLSDLLERESREEELAELLGNELDRAKDRRDTAAIVRLSLKLLRVLDKQRRYSDALDVCRSALEWSPSDRDLLDRQLRLCEAAGDPVAIADALEGLLNVEKGSRAAEIGRKLAALREELGEPEAAERALERASAACPDDEELRELILSRYSARGDYSRVADVLATAVASRPGDRGLAERLVEAQRAAGRHEAALATLAELVAVEPHDVGLLRRRAAVLSDLGRNDEALQDLERAYELEPALGGELAEALRRALGVASAERIPALTLRLVEVLERSGDLTGARATLSEFLERYPNDLEGWRRLASLDSRTGNVSEALITLERLVNLETGPGLVETALRYAEACELAGRPGDARGPLERALEQDPASREVRNRLQALYESIGATRELANMLLDDAEVSTDMEVRLSLLLRAAELLLLPDGDLDAAVRILEFARGESPDSLETVVLLARAYSAVGRGEEALALLQSVAEANRGRRNKALSAVYEQIASLHLEEGFLTDALQALSKAFEMDSKNARLAMLLGRLALDIEENEVAQRAFRAITIMRTAEPDDPDGARPENKADANYYLAVLAQKQGDVRKAKVLATKALAESPGHEAARKLVTELDKK